MLAVAREPHGNHYSKSDEFVLHGIVDVLALALANVAAFASDIDDDKAALSPDRRLASLNARELGILELLGDGLTSREIAARLYLSQRTLE